MTLGPIPIRSASGIQRDGTTLDAQAYVDGQWVRFQNGLPRKMGGYKSITSTLPEISRGLTAYPVSGQAYVHSGGATQLQQYDLSLPAGILSLNTNRTPGAPFVPSPNNLWQFAYIFDTNSQTLRVVAHPGQNLADITSAVNTNVLYGDAAGTAALADTTAPTVSGGVAALSPYLFAFGNAGYVQWCLPNQPSVWTGTGTGSAYITDKKIVTCLPYRNGAGGPAGIFWSLDSVIRTEFIGATGGYFEFDILSSQASIMSSQCVIEYDGVFFWMGVDRFMMFNGVVQEVKNTMNSDFLFDNINMAQRQKVFVFKVPRRGEIWWCFPYGQNQIECNHAVIYNIRENSWYDTALPGSGRSAAFYSQILNFPMMADLDLQGIYYTLWQHESGVDEILNAQVIAIDSYFTTADIAMFKMSQQPNLKGMHVARMEPDFAVQSGNLSVTVQGRSTASAPLITGTTQTIYPAPVAGTQQQTPNFKDVQRLMRFKFESNVAGGNYWLGHTIAHIEPADERFTT
jgi:hypothetical protein